MKILDFTQRFLTLDIAIIPLYHRSKIPMVAWHKYITKLPTEYQCGQWFINDWNNYAVIAGWQNLVVIDFDTLELFDLWRLWVGERLFESVFKVLTSRGAHVYIRTAAPAGNDKRIALSGGIDVQAKDKYVVGPGCTHPGGTQYVPVGELRLIEVESVETILPLHLFPRVSEKVTRFNGQVPDFAVTPTEYQHDPLAQASQDVDLITKVKRSVRIENLFTDTRRTSVDGRWLATLCPFHDDHNPSFWIDVHRQICGCNVCGFKPMDCINLFARMHNVSVSVAVVQLAEAIGVWR